MQSPDHTLMTRLPCGWSIVCRCLEKKPDGSGFGPLEAWGEKGNVWVQILVLPPACHVAQPVPLTSGSLTCKMGSMRTEHVISTALTTARWQQSAEIVSSIPDDSLWTWPCPPHLLRYPKVLTRHHQLLRLPSQNHWSGFQGCRPGQPLRQLAFTSCSLSRFFEGPGQWFYFNI